MTEQPEFYHESKVKATKDHRCVECGAKVPKGRWHIKATGKWEGEVCSYRFHKTCHELTVLMRTDLLEHLHQDELPGIGELVQATVDCHVENEYRRPDWWPAEIEGISHRHLQLYVEQVEAEPMPATRVDAI